jgi:hypothetical protein
MSCCCPYECECNRVVAPLPTTTTTTTLCPNAIICDEAVLMDCVVYSGCDALCPLLETGDSLVTVFAQLFDMYENCNGPLVPSTTTTTTTPGPIVLVPICLTYTPTGGCATSCALECFTHYTSSRCANYINTNAAPAALGCILYTDALGTTLAPDGWYSRPGGLCYILGSNSNSGEITGITNCI